MLEFRVLGPLEVVEHGQPLALGGPKQRALLAILVLRRGDVVSADRLIDLLWGERPPATAAKTLQGYVSHLRKALGDGVLLTRSGGYLLAAKPEQVDAERFEAAVADARDALAVGDAARARELLVSALALWRGEPLADLAYERFAGGEVARLEEARLAALEDRIEADLALGRHRTVVGELEALVVDHPNSERLLGQLMLALYRSGRQVEALDAYRRGHRALVTSSGSSRDRSCGCSSSASSRRTRRSRHRRLDGYGTAVRPGAGWCWLSSVRPSSRHPSRGRW
jgi:DNA-binding SARP family transcriptional activator